MIDYEELTRIRQRHEAARAAVDLVAVHTDGGLFGQIPTDRAAGLLPAAVASARDVPTLAAEVERLSPAAYLVGPEDCCEGACEEGQELPDGQWCSHVTEKVATLDDVQRADDLGRLVESLAEAAQRQQRGEEPDPTGNLRTLAELILDGAEDAGHRIDLRETTGVAG